MKRIDTINARQDINGQGKAGFHANDDLPGQDATYVSPSWLNAMQEEVANVIEKSDMQLDGQDNTQLYQAIRFQLKTLANAIYHVGSWHGSNNPEYNPSEALMPFFGYETTWILWPYLPKGVATNNEALGAISGLSTGSAFRAASTRIWQRLADGATGPTYQLSSDKDTVNEGEQIMFTLQTTGLAAGTPVDWIITGIEADDILPSTLSGQFLLDHMGKATVSFDVKADNKTEGNQTLVFKLAYIQGKQCSVLIMDTSKYPEGQTTYYEGTHTIEVQPEQIITLDMYGAGGGGGGSVYTPGYGADGTDGGNVSLTYLTNELVAGGGKKGTGGRWGNGSHYFNGEAGVGGENTIAADLYLDSNFEILINQKGNDAVIGSRWETQKGGAALPSSIGAINGGGDGATGVGDERWSYGGGGGSGGRLKIKFTNTTEEVVTLNLVVGTKGQGWKNGGKSGTDGGIGFAIVSTS